MLFCLLWYNEGMIKEIAFVSYAIENVAEARNFYENILGLKPSSVWEGDGMLFVEYEIGHSTLAIGKGAPNFKPGTTGATVALEVDNFENTVKTLKDKGIKFAMEAYETTVCHMAIVMDPDGNQIMIHKRKG